MKRFISILLSLALVMSGTMLAFGGTGESAGLENVIKKVKNVITVPEELEQFEYNAWEDERYGTQWYLEWHTEDWNKGISVSANSEGIIASYSRYDGDAERSGLSKISAAEAKKKGEAFIKKVLPETFKDVRIGEENNNYGNFAYTYRVYMNDIPVDFMALNVSVDKHSGEVSSYYAGFLTYDRDNSFEKADKVIGYEEAKAAYLEKIGVKLGYESTFRWPDRILTVFPAYKDMSNMMNAAYIDAVTGEVVTPYEEDFYYSNAKMAENEAAADAGGGLSREEQQKVDVLAELLTVTEAEKIFKETVPTIKNSSKLTYSSLTQSYKDKEQYIWSLYFNKAGDGSVDAATGQLLSFYSYEDRPEKGGTLSKDRAMATAESFISKIAGDKWEEMAFSEVKSQLDSKYGNSYSIAYVRQVDGVPFYNNYMMVEINKSNGKIYSFYSDWDKKAEFPSVEKAMSEEEAFMAFADDAGFGLKYIKGENNVSKLVYGFIDYTGYSMDPFTGERLNYDGTIYKGEGIKSYEDIAGKWYEDVVQRLLDNGYYIDSEKFEGNKQTTQEEFLRYLYSTQQQYYDREGFYDMLIDNDIVKEGEEAPEQLISRQDAAKFAVRYVGQGNIAEHYAIFKNPFKDRVQSEYTGYAAIASVLEIMKGDEKGRFNGSGILTRAQAAVIISNTLDLK